MIHKTLFTQVKCPYCSLVINVLEEGISLHHHYVGCWKSWHSEKIKKIRQKFAEKSKGDKIERRKNVVEGHPQLTGQGSYMCDECGKTFTTVFCLRAHVDLHK